VKLPASLDAPETAHPLFQTSNSAYLWYPNQWLLSAKVVCKRIPSSVGSKPNQFQLIDWIIFTGVVIETLRQQ
jgi:hypothetical protein